jgi:hypothetical protein
MGGRRIETQRRWRRSQMEISVAWQVERRL